MSWLKAVCSVTLARRVRYDGVYSDIQKQTSDAAFSAVIIRSTLVNVGFFCL